VGRKLLLHMVAVNGQTLYIVAATQHDSVTPNRFDSNDKQAISRFCWISAVDNLWIKPKETLSGE
jgi:hypothetical protein